MNPNVGCNHYGDVQLPVAADFVLHIEGKDNTRMLVEKPYHQLY